MIPSLHFRDGTAYLHMEKKIQKFSKEGDLVLVEVCGELHFGVVAFASRRCIWTNSPLEHGTILGVKVAALPEKQRIYTYEPFEDSGL